MKYRFTTERGNTWVDDIEPYLRGGRDDILSIIREDQVLVSPREFAERVKKLAHSYPSHLVNVAVDVAVAELEDDWEAPRHCCDLCVRCGFNECDCACMPRGVKT